MDGFPDCPEPMKQQLAPLLSAAVATLQADGVLP
ncbi:hypothetical protein MNBD_GAMMA14-825, partial [hydrothermal vent metagenome]